MTSATKKIFDLNPWQRVQAAMLYHFASLDYLKGLHQMVTQLIDDIVDPLLELAQKEGRDSHLVSSRWGARNTSENWANNAWPFLKDLQGALSKDIAGRSFERFNTTAVNNCFRGLSEYSMQWASATEEEQFNNRLQDISNFAHKIDNTLDTYYDSKWSDYGFAYNFSEFASTNHQISKFRIRDDVIGKRGEMPPRTGVYISQDDPNAALQFAWCGDGGGKLRQSKTFNDIGVDALNDVGRAALWFDEQKMFEFARSEKYLAIFKEDIYSSGIAIPRLAPSAVARRAFTDRPCSWYFVEVVNGEFEEIALSRMVAPQKALRHRIAGGQPCPETGFYFTPAHQSSRRRFVRGEIMPALESQYGETIWQWDAQQS